jgi:hypothetical protein
VRPRVAARQRISRTSPARSKRISRWVERQRVAHRDEIAGALRREQPGRARDLRHRALGPAAREDDLGETGREADLRAGDRGALGDRLRADVDHPRLRAVRAPRHVGELPPARGLSPARGAHGIRQSIEVDRALEPRPALESDRGIHDWTMKVDVDVGRVHEQNRRFHDEVEAEVYDQRMGIRYDAESTRG